MIKVRSQAISTSSSYAGQSGTLLVTRAPCRFCVSSISATARSLGLAKPVIETPDGGVRYLYARDRADTGAVMGEPRATVVLERCGETSSPRSGLSPEEVAEAVRGLGGGHDVTLIISPEGIDERLMVAVDGSRAFLGLERPDGLLQFAVSDDYPQGEAQPFTIGSQESEIESRYLPDLTLITIKIVCGCRIADLHVCAR